MLSKQNICKALLIQRAKTPFSRQDQLSQNEPFLIELRGTHFLDRQSDCPRRGGLKILRSANQRLAIHLWNCYSMT